MTAAGPAVLVTGASRGIGAAAARWLALAGARVTVVARSGGPLRSLVDTIAAEGGRAHALVADLAEPDAAGQVVQAAVDTWGGVDALVNNAALVAPIARVGAVDPGDWARTVAVDLLAPLALIRAALPHLRARRGRVVNVVSTAAHLPLAGLSAYCCAKAGLLMLTRVLAAEEPQVTVLAVQPGPVDTDMQGALRDGGEALDAERLAYYQSLQEQGELRSADVPGKALAWLAWASPPAWSGREIAHDDPEVTAGAAALPTGGRR